MELFNRDGTFRYDADTAELSPEALTLWGDVRDAAKVHDEINAALKASEARVTELMGEVAAASNYLQKFKGQTTDAAIRDFLYTERQKYADRR